MNLGPKEYRKPLLRAVLEAAARYGAGHVVAVDQSGTLTYRQLFTRSFILSDKLNAMLGDDKYVAVMLPNSLGAAVTFVALQMLNRVPCMLNFSSGETNILHACRIAQAKTVLTSRVFIAKGKLENIATALEKEHRVIYLEDLRSQIGALDKLKGAIKSFFVPFVLKKIIDRQSPDDPAVILYTSGSEGAPKGVALSHANILSNIAQACLRLDLSARDKVFNAMPVFHSFGLTVGMLMPLARGIATYLYPSPVQYKQIPPLIEASGATILLGTDTFYNGWLRHSERKNYAKIRLAVAGAEKLRDATRERWLTETGVDILQGYGVTETSPAASINTPKEHKPGTVGKLFPGMEARLEKVEGLNEGGRLLLKGPNVMLGYLKADQPGVIQHQGEWYDTGDIVTIDAEGFIAIAGRAKRFAKIAGEMVSLVAVEELAHSLNAEAAHAAVAIPDDKRGEQIVLYTEDAGMTQEALVARASERGVAKICLPAQVKVIKELPRLGSGKIDYLSLQRQAKCG